MTPDAGRPLDVVVVHETNGRKYFEALLHLQQTGRIRSIEFYETSVLWKFAHSVLRERKPVGVALRQSLRNLRFRLTCWSLRDRVVLVGAAPWDYRVLLFAPLRHANALVYHTSWPRWDADVPKRLGPLTGLVRRGWLRLLRKPGVGIAAATGLSGASAAAAAGPEAGAKVTVIRHVVSDAFFAHRARHATPFRLLFLGELSEKKGLPDLLRVMDLLAGQPVGLDIVGDGPLRAMAASLAERPDCTWHGHVRDRARLAEIVAGCQMLIQPAVRTGNWEELFGISIVEAMASGVPCIASDHIGPCSIITPGVDGILLPEHSPDAIAEHVSRMVADPAAWAAMSAAAMGAARDYGLQKTAEQWESLFQGRIAGRHRIPGA